MPHGQSSLRRFILLAAMFLLWAGEAAAQTAQMGGRSITDGLTLPPASAATVDDAASGVINPAGIGLMRGLQLEYFHEREQAGASIIGDGVYLADTLLDQLALGVSLEWIRPALGVVWPSDRKTHIEAAWSPDPRFSAGLGFNIFSSDLLGLDGVTSWDAGMTFRPVPFLSVAGSVRDLDTPTLLGLVQPRRYDLGIALRPVGETLTIAADYLFEGEQDLPQFAEGPRNGRVGLTARVQLFRGLSLLLGGALPLDSTPTPFYNQTSAPFVEAGLSIDTDHVGIVGAAGAPTNRLSTSSGNLVVGARWSQEAFPAIPAPAARVAVVNLERELEGPSPSVTSLLFPAPVLDPFENLLAELDEAGRDPGLSAVLLRVGDLPDTGIAKIEELRRAIARLRAHGKKVVVMWEGGGDHELYLATAADRILALPQATYVLHGLSASALFFGEGLTKLGVKVEVVRVGPYKDAPDALTRASPSPAQQEVMRSLLADGMDRYVTTVVQDRHLQRADFLALLDRGITTAEQAKGAGLIDEVAYPDEIGRALHKFLHEPVLLEDDYLGRPTHEQRWGKRDAIGLVNVFGLITGGRSGPGAFGMVKTTGAETAVQALHDASTDPDIAAIVLRVDSGGGDVEASELIWRAVVDARKAKPVIVSLGDVAASGGYYVAVGGDEIIAEPSTVTGSIGVFALKPDVSGLLGKIGVHSYSEATTKNADLFDFTRSWTAGETDVMQKSVDGSYEVFLDRVAAGRKLAKSAVDAVGRGRVWSGQQALARHLVDRLGSLDDAVERARIRADLSLDEPIELVIFGVPEPKLPFGGVQSSVSTVNRLLEWAPGLAPLLVLDPGRPLALPEAQIQVR